MIGKLFSNFGFGPVVSPRFVRGRRAGFDNLCGFPHGFLQSFGNVLLANLGNDS